jgi:pilus assembly protein Flp/PilA
LAIATGLELEFCGAKINIMKYLVSRFIKDQSGATAIEYGLIAGLIGVVIITAVTSVGTKMSGSFTKIAGNLK